MGHFIFRWDQSQTLVWGQKFGLRHNQYEKREVMLDFGLRPECQTKSIQISLKQM